MVNVRTQGRGMSAFALAAAVLLGAVGCSSTASNSAEKATAAAVSTTAPAGAQPTALGAGGPCRATMNHITDAGKKITADAKDKAKATADLQQISGQFTADAEQIKNPEAKAAAKQLGAVYQKLADSAKNNQSPDMKTLPGEVQSAVTALSKCSAAE
ncbi:hypothetical protein [Kitasatospora sp. McL0602]|uniref:hypothetical protein n=1 Tax=Kitasatospora sp. McL0602 TaxID=3439530 RepID=UPI003F8A2718